MGKTTNNFYDSCAAIVVNVANPIKYTIKTVDIEVTDNQFIIKKSPFCPLSFLAFLLADHLFCSYQTHLLPIPSYEMFF